MTVDTERVEQTPETPETMSGGRKNRSATQTSEPAEIFCDSSLQDGAVRKVLPPNAGKGRVKGVPNRVTADTKVLVAQFVEHNMEGAQALYDRVAAKSPARALGLLAKFAGMVLPRQSQHTGNPLVAIQVGGNSPLTPDEAYKLLIADATVDHDAIMARVVTPAIEGPK